MSTQPVAHMSACEKCWKDAGWRSIHNGKSQYDNYLDLLREHAGLAAMATRLTKSSTDDHEAPAGEEEKQ